MPLGEDRFQALLNQAQAFFAHAERDEAAEKAAAIQDILALMKAYDLGIEDLQD